MKRYKKYTRKGCKGDEGDIHKGVWREVAWGLTDSFGTWGLLLYLKYLKLTFETQYPD